MKPKKVRRIYNVAVLVGLGIVLASYIPSVLEIVIGSYDPFLNSIHTTMIHMQPFWPSVSLCLDLFFCDVHTVKDY